MPSPFSRDQLSADMRRRYGLDRRPVGRWIAVGVVLAAFVGALAFVTVNLRTATIDARLIGWDVTAPDRVDLRLDVRRPSGAAATCVLRAQDRDHIDVAYARVDIATGPSEVTIDYALRTLAPAAVVEVLGCSTDGPPAVIAPQFPPGIVPPPQPY